MSTTVIIELLPIKEVDNKSVAHIRIARYLDDILVNGHLINTPEEFKTWWNRHIDNIVIMYASRFYAHGRFEFVEKFIANHSKAKLFWCINEYNLVPNSSISRLFKNRGCHVIANFVEKGMKFKHYTEFTKVNMNITAYRNNARVIDSNKRKYNCLYYGTFRPDRAKYFAEYLPYCITSTSKKNILKFKKLVKNGKYIDKLTWNGGRCFLRNFRYSLYIEDVFTHNHYNHLGDRFYEALAYDVLLLFDKNCINTVRQSQYPVQKMNFISSGSDLLRTIENINRNYCEALKEQQKLKENVLCESAETRNQLLKILR